MKKPKPKNKDEPRLINIPVGILFHFCKKHSDYLLGLRAWLATRALSANQGNWADTAQIMKAIKIKRFKPFKRKLMRSGLFHHVGRKKLFPLAARKIINKHRLNYRRIIIRAEKINASFLKNIASNKRLSAYITKIYFENDLRPNSKYHKSITYGRISQERASQALNLCRTTIIDNLKVSKARKRPNIIIFNHLKIRNNYGRWLLDKELLTPNKNISKKIGDNFNIYFECKTPQGNVLAARYPDIFRFTGHSLKVVSRRSSKQHHCSK